MKILLNQHLVFSQEAKFNALSKAREDVTTTLSDSGYRVVNLVRQSLKNGHLTMLLIWWDLFCFALSIGRGNDVLMQYPVDCHPNKLKLFARLLHRRKNKLTVLIHDLEFIRFQDNQWKQDEAAFFNEVDTILAHTNAMKQALVDAGVRSEIRVIHLFDYHTSDPLPDEETLIGRKHTVAFAGNLIKSKFIAVLLQKQFSTLQFNYYGLPVDLPFDGTTHRYQGKFSPSNVSFVQGGWGLVWDGDSLDTCSGEMGNYLRYNASHKLSLYLAAGMPVIVWKESGLARWIVEQELGLAVTSLTEVEQVIEGVSEQQYIRLIASVAFVSKQLRRGAMLSSIL